VIYPIIPGFPAARFPGVVVFRFVGSMPEGSLARHIMQLVSEIYQVTGPVERFAGQIASQGFVVACPSSFHEFEGPDPIPYDTEGTPPANISP
jgi:carboxymethylenebutenolidase